MPTPAQIDEQIQLERDAIAQGLKKLHKNTRDLEGKEYASATVYGAASIDTLLPLVVARIEATVEYAIKKGKTGAAFKEIQKYLADVEPLAAAALAVKITFDKVFSYKEKSNQAVNVCDLLVLLLNKSVKCDTMKNMHQVSLKHLKTTIGIEVSVHNKRLLLSVP